MKKKRSGTDGGYLVRHTEPSRQQRRAEAAAAARPLPPGWVSAGKDAQGKALMRKATGSVQPRGKVRAARKQGKASRRANRP